MNGKRMCRARATALVVLAMLVAVGCAPTGEKAGPVAKVAGPSLRWTAVTFGDSIGTRSAPEVRPRGEHARVVLTYPRIDAAATPAVADTLNAFVRRFVLADQVGGTAASPESLATPYLAGFRSFRKDFPESAQEWFVERAVAVVFDSAGVVTLRGNEFRFDGGAHPSTSELWATFDAATGRRLTLADVLAPGAEDSVEAIGERAFRAARRLDPAKGLAEQGFFADANGKFSLHGDRFGVTGDGLVFHYNAYDVAPYSSGPTTITLPWAEVGSYLAPDGPVGEWAAPARRVR